MQTDVMIPRMPGYKIALFTKRMVAFHETFAPIGKFVQKKPTGVIWNESISGRNADDLASSHMNFMRKLPRNAMSTSREVQFRKGHEEMFWKESFQEDSFKSAVFPIKKISREVLKENMNYYQRKTVARGILACLLDGSARQR